MERLIVEHGSGDGCSYSCTVTTPVVAESRELFLSEIKAAVEKFQKDTRERLRFDDEEKVCGVTFYLGDLVEDDVYYAPRVYTVDQYFAQLEK